MLLARVVGTVVATRKDPRLEGKKLLVVKTISPHILRAAPRFTSRNWTHNREPDLIVPLARSVCPMWSAISA